MALYEELSKVDVISPVIDSLKSGNFRMNWKGKIKPEEEVSFNRQYITNVFCKERKCHLWKPIYFDRYRIIPKGCRSCWKIVMRPKTLRRLMEIMNLQRNLKIPAKTGLELRPFTGKLGGYGAYWYAPMTGGLEGGRKLMTKLQKEFPKDELILKRGCTEMERSYYPSSSWDKLRESWNFREALLDATYESLQQIPTKEPGAYVTYILITWIEHAFEYEDETYRDYTDASFEMLYETYHHEGNKPNKFKIEDFRSEYEPDNTGPNCNPSKKDSEIRVIK